MNRTVRNLIIFSVVTIACGWVGAWINTQIPSPSPQESLGLLFWLIAPLVTALLLRSFGGDGWGDFGLRFNFKGNWGWYALAVSVYPVTIILTLSLSLLFGSSTLERPLAEFLPIFITGFVGALIKNIFEEFAWRGYLTPRFKAAGLGNLQNHLLTALIWGCWHIPYWVFFLKDVIAQYTSIGLIGFIVIALIGIIPVSIVLGELRLKTDSVWPSYIAHNLTNALSAPLLIEGFFKLKPGMEFVFSANTDSLVMIALFWGIGWWMMRKKG